MVEVPERVRHEPDRSCTVLVSGPQGEVVVGTTTRTDQVLTVAREGAARVFGVSELGLDRLHLSMPQPPYGRDGQTVRITSVSDPDDPSERELLGAVATSAHERKEFCVKSEVGASLVVGPCIAVTGLAPSSV